MFATAALVLTACSSEDEIVQNSPQQAPANAVLFDTYTSSATRAGDPAGVMTTEKLKTAGKGFGVFAMYQNPGDLTPGSFVPNFMFNEHVSWSDGWTYSPLKYWPNETTKDSQDPAAASAETDKLSFFAYAPYVDLSAATGTMKVVLDPEDTKAAYIGSGETSGIISYTKEDITGDPLVEYAVSNDPDNNVDLLWGVAPAGMSYQNVSGSNTTVTTGMPLLNMVKPDKDQKMKFLFQHALSRIGLSVVSAIDQIAAGDDGGKYNTAETRVLIEDVKIWGNFGKKGVLNLNNTSANVANWIEASVDRTPSTSGSPQFIINASKGLAPDLRYDEAQITAIASDASAFSGLQEGVLPSEKALMVGGPDPSKKVGDAPSAPEFEWGKTYYKFTDPDYELANVTYSNSADLYTYNETDDKYTQAYTSSETSVELDGKSAKLYTLTLGSAVANGGAMTNGDQYYKKTVVDGKNIFTIMTSDGTAADAADTYYPAAGFSGTVITGMPAYASAQYWTGLLPRYFMVIPSDVAPTPTEINVKITYRVVTKDTKLTGNVSNVSNAITKQTSIQLQSVRATT